MNAASPFLTIPAARAERWELLRGAVADWYRPLQDHDGVSLEDLDSAKEKLAIRLPKALREWLHLAGRRRDVWSRQDHLLDPNEFRFKDGYLVFLVENQAVVEWGIRRADLALDDPPVYVASVDDPPRWSQESDTLSRFVLQWFAYCLKWSDDVRWWANAYVGSEVFDILESSYPRLPFDQWSWPAPAKFYGLRDFIAETQIWPIHDHGWLYVVARTAAAGDSFKERMARASIEWEVNSDDWPPGWVSAASDPGG